jgi:hypothetical protein
MFTLIVDVSDVSPITIPNTPALVKSLDGTSSICFHKSVIALKSSDHLLELTPFPSSTGNKKEIEKRSKKEIKKNVQEQTQAGDSQRPRHCSQRT